MAGKDFFELVKAIGESKSKQEEDRIVAEEVGLAALLSAEGSLIVLYLLWRPQIVFLKKKIAEQGNKKKMKEFVVR